MLPRMAATKAMKPAWIAWSGTNMSIALS